MGLSEWPEKFQDNTDEEEFVEVAVDNVVAETPQALLLQVDGEARWVPKYLIGDDSDELDRGDEGVAFLPLWWLDQEGLDWG